MLWGLRNENCSFENDKQLSNCIQNLERGHFVPVRASLE